MAAEFDIDALTSDEKDDIKGTLFNSVSLGVEIGWFQLDKITDMELIVGF